MPQVEMEEGLENELALKAAEEQRRRKRLDPSEVGAWVEVGGRSGPPRDLSPPRRSSANDTSRSPPTNRRYDSGSDLSPPRNRSPPGEDLSPPRRRRLDSDDDLSPPRRPVNDADLSPPRRGRHDSPSPPRRPQAHASSDDLSPPRNRSRRHDSPSPIRRDSDADLSPPRKRAKRNDTPSPPRGDRVAPKPTTAPANPIGGLVMASDVVEEARARKQREMEALRGRDDTSMGKDAATVYRDRHGRKLGSSSHCGSFE